MSARLFPSILRWLAARISNPAAPEVRGEVEADNIHIDAQGKLVPYDETMLERALTHWQFGDWPSLANLDRNTMQHHPARARLALLAASGHQQTGNVDGARQFLRLAQDWGCSKKLMSQVLISGVHNTLGRAAAAGAQDARALQHFEAAIATGSAGNDVCLLARARAAQQFAQLGLPDNGSAHRTDGDADRRLWLDRRGQSAQSAPSVPPAATALADESARLVALLEKQSEELHRFKRDIAEHVQKQMLNSEKQLTAFRALQAYFQPGEPMPEFHGWPVSPDFALYMLRLVEGNDYDLIIEFGSGTSTLLIAKALAKAGPRQGGKAATRQVAFEHLEKYHTQSLANLHGAHVDAEVVLAPLSPYVAPNGNTYSYYACHDAMATLAVHYARSGCNILLVVDGPPGITGKHARYPALPAVRAHFPTARIDILLDDYARDDEKEIVKLWITELQSAGLKFNIHEEKMEKDACLIHVAGQG